MREIRIRPFLKAIAAMAVIAALSGVQSAQALDQELQITVDGVTTTYHAPNGGSASTGGNVTLGAIGNQVTINANISDNNPGGAGGSFLQGATVTLRNVSGNNTVSISVGDTNWSAPTAPPTITATSSLGGTSTFTGATNLSLQSYIDQSNAQNGTTSPYSPGSQTTYSSGSVGSGGGLSFNLAAASVSIPSLSSLFSMTSVVSLSLSNSAVVNFTTDLVLSSVPEPSSMAIAGLGALGMIGYGLRRRKALGA